MHWHSHYVPDFLPKHDNRINYLKHHNKNFSQLINDYRKIESEINLTEEYILNSLYANNLREKLKLIENELKKLAVYGGE